MVKKKKDKKTNLLSSASLPPRSGLSVGEHHNMWLCLFR